MQKLIIELILGVPVWLVFGYYGVKAIVSRRFPWRPPEELTGFAAVLAGVCILLTDVIAMWLAVYVALYR